MSTYHSQSDQSGLTQCFPRRHAAAEPVQPASASPAASKHTKLLVPQLLVLSIIPIPAGARLWRRGESTARPRGICGAMQQLRRYSQHQLPHQLPGDPGFNPRGPCGIRERFRLARFPQEHLRSRQLANLQPSSSMQCLPSVYVWEWCSVVVWCVVMCCGMREDSRLARSPQEHLRTGGSPVGSPAAVSHLNHVRGVV